MGHGATGLLICIALLLGLAGCNAQSNWVETVSESGGFKVHFPRRTHISYREVETPFGKVFWWGCSTHNDDGPPHYSVNYYDFHAADVQKYGAQALLKIPVAIGPPTFKQTKVTDEKTIQISGHSGIEYVLEGVYKEQTNLIFYCRTYLRNTRLYVLTLNSETPIGEETRKKFFDSFELLGK